MVCSEEQFYASQLKKSCCLPDENKPSIAIWTKFVICDFTLKYPAISLDFMTHPTPVIYSKFKNCWLRQLIVFLFFSESEEETEETKKKKKLEDAMKRLEAEEREAERMLRWVT